MTGQRVFGPLALLLILAGSAFAQDDTCSHRKLPVTVLDPAGRPLQNLTAGDFQAKLRGKSIEILGVSKNTRPRRVVILLDASGSMLDTEHDKWQTTLEVAGGAVLHLPTDTQVALNVFDEKIAESLDFSAGRMAVAEEIIVLKAGPKVIQSKYRRTALWDSLLKSLSLFDQPGPGDAVYLISDGGDNWSKTSPHQVEEAFLMGGVRLFTFLLISRTYLGYLDPDEEEGLNALKDLSVLTGGDHVVLAIGGKTGRSVFQLGKEERAVVVRATQDIYAQIHELAWLDISLPLSVDKPREWTLQLNASQNKTFKDFELRYPHKLLPCSASPPTN